MSRLSNNGLTLAAEKSMSKELSLVKSMFHNVKVQRIACRNIY